MFNFIKSSYKKKFDNYFNSLLLEFNKAYSVKESNKKLIELISQINQVDHQIENYKSTDNQRDLSIKFHWGHNHKFNNTINLIGRMENRHLLLLTEYQLLLNFNLNNFNNATVLDVGCWTGGTALAINLFKPKKIKCTEEVKKYFLASKKLINEILKIDKIIFEESNLFKITENNIFDIVNFPGVIYHLSDPIVGLRILHKSLKPNGTILIETEGYESEESVAKYMGNRIFFNNENENENNLNRGGWNHFCPSPKCLENWMIEAGFKEIIVKKSPINNRLYASGKKDANHRITKSGLSREDLY